VFQELINATFASGTTPKGLPDFSSKLASLSDFKIVQTDPFKKSSSS